MELREAQPQQVLQAESIQLRMHGICLWQGESVQRTVQRVVIFCMYYGTVESIP